MRFNVLDNTSGSLNDSNRTATSKWWFNGTYDELVAWLPSIGDDASFSPENENETDNKVWCPAGYKITDASYTAVNRFEWGISIEAGITTGGGGGGFSFPDRSNLANEHKLDLSVLMFFITEEMVGFQIINSAYVEIKNWDANQSAPFLNSDGTIYEIPKEKLHSKVQIYRRKEILFLSGRPCEHADEQKNFYHIETIGGTYLGSCWNAEEYTGIVRQNDMTSIVDDKGNYWTQWDRAVDVAPIGLKWNPNFEHFA